MPSNQKGDFIISVKYLEKWNAPIKKCKGCEIPLTGKDKWKTECTRCYHESRIKNYMFI